MPRLVAIVDEMIRPTSASASASADRIDLGRALKFGRKRLDPVHYYPYSLGRKDNISEIINHILRRCIPDYDQCYHCSTHIDNGYPFST